MEYALEAFKRVTAAVSVKDKDVVILGCDAKSGLLSSSRTFESPPSRSARQDIHVSLVFAGLNAHARILVDKSWPELTLSLTDSQSKTQFPSSKSSDTLLVFSSDRPSQVVCGHSVSLL